MKDEDMTREQLIGELAQMRQRIAELEASEAQLKQAERAMRNSEEKCRQLIENLQEGVWVIDKEAYTSFVNPRMAEMLGYTVDEMLGKHLFSFMDQYGVEIATRNLERRQHGIREQHDFEFLRKDGTRVYMLLETSPIIDEEGNYAGAIAGVQDITQRKQMEEALQETEERYRDLLENANDLIQSVMPDGHFLYVNKMWQKTLGYSDEEITDLRLWDIIHPDFVPHCWEVFQKVMSGEQQNNVEAVFIAKDGKSVTVEGNVNCRFEGEEPVATRGIFRDITKCKKLEEALRESEEQSR